jgi:catechol 2,3-dioxygenase-like lactoylglutathione lyase family enzyme
MPDFPTSNPEQFIQGCPVLHVRDVNATASWFRDVLGFHWDFGDEHYAVVWRDNSAIHLLKADGEPSGMHLFQWVRNVDRYYAEITARGARVSVEPGDRPYGRDFTVVTPGGLAIVFGQDIE